MDLKTTLCTVFAVGLVLTGTAPRAEAVPRKAHQQGKPPRRPQAALPADAPRQAQDRAARRRVAGRPLIQEQNHGARGPQLRALRDADWALFPRQLNGFRPGWSWDDAEPSVQADGLPPVVRAVPSAKLDAAARVEWLRSLTLPDFNARLDPKVVEYLEFYRDTKHGKTIARIWAKKVGRYAPAIRAELARRGLPKDLVWLSLVESGHNPTIRSPAGAAGLWQFIPATARMYGLTVDPWVDERLNPKRSTEAAAAFLSDLYQRFGNWELSMAAYNMGHAGLLRAIRKYNTNDLWALTRYEAGLPWETSLYVPKIVAIAIIMNNRRAFGLDKIPLDPPVAYDTIYVTAGTSLAAVATAAGVPLDAVRTMNPQYLKARTPPSPPTASKERGHKAGDWSVVVPRGAGEGTLRRLARRPHRAKSPTLYTVRVGDTMQTVADRVWSSPKRIAALNGLGVGASLSDGLVLRVPDLPKGKRYRADIETVVGLTDRVRKVPGRQRVLYKTVARDTLAGVARALGVTTEELAAWNEADPRAQLQAGMVFQAFVSAPGALHNVRTIAPEHTNVVRVGDPTFLQLHEAEKGRRRIVIRAREHDTLRKIGQRYHLSSGMMERINHYSRDKKLEPGQRVIVYTPLKKPLDPIAPPDAVPVANARR